MKYFTCIALILVWFCFIQDCGSQNPVKLKEALEAYDAEDYQTALQHFEAILGDSLLSPELYFNIANCHLKLNHLGLSILYYEKALKAEPTFKEAKANLEIARTYIVESVVPTEEFFLKRIVDRISFLLTPAHWWWLCLLCFIMASGFYMSTIFGYSGIFGIQVKSWIIGLVIGGLLFASLTWYRYSYSSNSDYSIYMNKEGTLKQAPSDKSEDVLNLSEGLKCLKLDEVNGWILIRLEDYQQGWVRTEALMDI